MLFSILKIVLKRRINYITISIVVELIGKKWMCLENNICQILQDTS